METNSEYEEGEEEEEEEEEEWKETEDEVEYEEKPEKEERIRDDQDDVHYRVSKETLKEIERLLCLIRLSWPKVDIEKDVYLSTLPESYSTVSSKERLLLWYAENFRRQLNLVHVERKPFFLVCENECGVQKFVSTTIRRSTLPYPELYTWQGCAKFVSDYIEYEPPHEPLLMPKHLRTPTWLLRFQKGNSFECATLLVSLLIGQGYNAFVASGYASKEQTLCDMRKRSYPHPLPFDLDTSGPPEDQAIPKYKLKPPQDFNSQFLVEMETREKQKIQADIERQEEERQRLIIESEKPPPDKLKGYRIHAWVVVLPESEGVRRQEVTEPFFIEPSSGMSYNLKNEKTNNLYFGVESIWNDRNYWVNMQTPTGNCAKIDWDLTKINLWEHLLPGEPWALRDTGDTLNILDQEKDVEVEQEKHLDMPFTYVKEINISSQDFEKRYPNGKKVSFFKKVKIEKYAPYVQTDGLIKEIVLYEDYQYTVPIRVYKKYLHRADNLIKILKNLDTNHVVEYYRRGRIDGCKEHQYYSNESDTIDSRRILEFYDMVRTDGLSRIEAHAAYLTQHYIGRDDLLYYRHTAFSTDPKLFTQEPNIHYRQIRNIVEKYHRNEKVPASKDIAIREFALEENEIRLKYHYEKDHCTRTMRTFIRPSLTERGERLSFNPSMTHGYNSNPLAQTEKSLDLFTVLREQLKEEDRCISNIRDAEIEIVAFIKTRINETVTPHLTTSLFDKNRAIEGMPKKDDLIHDSSERDIMETDFLGPYIARIGHPKHVNKTQAYIIQEDCLSDFKQLLIERANRMLHKFQKYEQEFNKLQSMLTQNEELPPEEEEEILARTNELKFYLHTLETRLSRHKDLVSERYRMMVNFLRHNKRLIALHK